MPPSGQDVGSSASRGGGRQYLKDIITNPLDTTLASTSLFDMTHLQLEPSLLNTLAGRVVVLTGGATGIGHSTVQQLCSKTLEYQSTYLPV